MMTTRGSQKREDIEDTDYVVCARISDDEVLLRDKTNDNVELFSHNDNYSGHVIMINGHAYEFIRTALPGDLWWANEQILP